MCRIKDISIIKISIYLVLIFLIWLIFFYEKEVQKELCPANCGPSSNQGCYLYGKCCALNATSYDSNGMLIGGEGCCYGNGKGTTKIMQNNELASDRNLLCYNNKFYSTNLIYNFAEIVDLCKKLGNFYATKDGWKYGDLNKDPECFRG